MVAYEKKRILLIDDHPLTRKGLVDAIKATPDLMVCGEADGWHTGLRCIQEFCPDLVVLDLNLKDGNGWDLLKQLGLDADAPPILVLSVCNEEVYAVRLLKAGAKGYLMKDAAIDVVLDAIRKILNGHIAVSDTVASTLIQTASMGTAHAVADSEIGTLSDRELQVLEFLRQRLSNKEIALRLHLSHKTVSTYKTRLMEKLGVRTSPDLIAKLVEHSCRGSERFSKTSTQTASQGGALP